MAICTECGNIFDLTSAKMNIDEQFGDGVYDDYYPDGDVCEDCAYETIGADSATGAEIMELNQRDWFSD